MEVGMAGGEAEGGSVETLVVQEADRLELRCLPESGAEAKDCRKAQEEEDMEAVLGVVETVEEGTGEGEAVGDGLGDYA